MTRSHHSGPSPRPKPLTRRSRWLTLSPNALGPADLVRGPNLPGEIMKFKSTIAALAAAFVFTGALTGAASAAVIYDESVSGDIGNDDFGLLTDTNNTFLGTLDGGPSSTTGPDESDLIRFEMASAFTLNIDILSGVDTVLFFYRYNGMNYELLGAGGSSDATLYGPEFLAGMYRATLVPIGNSNMSAYAFSVLAVEGAMSEVPLPAALPLFLAGLGGIGLMRRRKTA